MAVKDWTELEADAGDTVAKLAEGAHARAFVEFSANGDGSEYLEVPPGRKASFLLNANTGGTDANGVVVQLLEYVGNVPPTVTDPTDVDNDRTFEALAGAYDSGTCYAEVGPGFYRCWLQGNSTANETRVLAELW